MAAGLGFKTFTTGEVLTAADTNGYLMQGILVFATEAARNAAITSPQEGQFAFTKDTNSTWFYDGAAWVASGGSGDVTGVTAGTGITVTSPTGPVPTITNDMATTITAAGDIVVGTGSGTYDNLPIGTTAQVLTADTTVSPYKVKWATPSASASGLTFITGAAFTTVASVSLPNSTFTSTYTNYKLVFNITSAAGAAAETRFRMRASGTDDTAANYYMGGMTVTYAGSNSIINVNGGTYIPYGTIAAGSGGINSQSTQFEMTLFSPQTSSATVFTTMGGRGSWTWTAQTGINNSSTAFDSLTYFVDAGTITGNYRVYGYQNS